MNNVKFVWFFMLPLKVYLLNNNLRIANRLKRIIYINIYLRNSNFACAKVKNNLSYLYFLQQIWYKNLRNLRKSAESAGKRKAWCWLLVSCSLNKHHLRSVGLSFIKNNTWYLKAIFISSPVNPLFSSNLKRNFHSEPPIEL